MKTMSKKIAYSFIVGTALLVSAARAADDENIIAHIGSEEIKTDEIRAAIQGMSPQEQAVLSKNPNLLKDAIQLLLVQKIVLKEALAKQWDQQPTVVAQLERTRINTISESYIQSLAKVPDDFPNDADLHSFYETRKTSLLAPRQYQLAQIFVAQIKGADQVTADRAKQKIENIQRNLEKNNADFSTLALTMSEQKQTAERGGEIGWVPEPRMAPDVRSQVTKLAKNGITQPIFLDDGWYIMKVLDIKESHTPSFDEAKDQLVQELRSNRAQTMRQAYLAKLLQANPLTINDAGLSKILSKPVEPLPAAPKAVMNP